MQRQAVLLQDVSFGEAFAAVGLTLGTGSVEGGNYYIETAFVNATYVNASLPKDCSPKFAFRYVPVVQLHRQHGAHHLRC